MSQPHNSETAQQVATLLEEHYRSVTTSLPHSQEGLATVDCAHDEGLLYVPGRLHDTEDEPLRAAHEQDIIKKAMLRGQPILAVCAGAWRLWEQGASLSNPSLTAAALRNTLSPVKDHAYKRMMSITTSGRVGYNVDLHFVVVEPGSMLHAATAQCTKFTANSVHWKSPDETQTPAVFTISAISKGDSSMTQKSRQGIVLRPEEGKVEAFEAIRGSPTLGIQWHPEDTM